MLHITAVMKVISSDHIICTAMHVLALDRCEEMPHRFGMLLFPYKTQMIYLEGLMSVGVPVVYSLLGVLVSRSYSLFIIYSTALDSLLRAEI